MRIFPENESEIKSGGAQSNDRLSVLRYLPWIKIAAVACLAIFVGVSIISTCLSEVCFTAYVGGKEIGLVKSPDAVESALAQVKSDFLYGIDYSDVDFKLSYSYTAAPERKLLEHEEITDELKNYVIENYVSAYELSVNGYRIGTCLDKEDVDTVVELVSTELYEKIVSVDSATYDIVPGNAIVVSNVLCKAETLTDSRSIYGVLSAMAGVEGKLYGDYGENDYKFVHTGSSDIRTSPYTSTCDFDCGLLKNSDCTISVYHHDHASTTSQRDFALFYNTVKNVTFTEIVQYETEYVEDPNMMVGRSSKITDGTNGLREVNYKITFSPDGAELSREVVSEEVLTPPVNEVYRIGTKPVPDTVPTGTYIWPLEEYIITSYYGVSRPGLDYGSGHYGIDLAADKGDPIYAADSGTVVQAKLTPSYGLLVIIDHGNGIQTYYAHMSKILVSVGDKVYQSQQIGRVGRTGTATGNHLHFEVRINGETDDPMNYLPKQETTVNDKNR